MLNVSQQDMDTMLAVLRDSGLWRLQDLNLFYHWYAGVPGFPLQYTEERKMCRVLIDPVVVEKRSFPDDVFLPPEGCRRVDKLDVDDLFEELSGWYKKILDKAKAEDIKQGEW